MAIGDQIYEIVKLYVADVSCDIRLHGPLWALLLHTILRNARPVLASIQKNVVGPDSSSSDEASEAALTIRDSYNNVFVGIGVAGAIFAQVSISAQYLFDVGKLSWTIIAAFSISAISGALSTYFACLVQLKMNGFISHAEIKEWLTAPHVIRERVFDNSSAGTLENEEVFRAHLGRKPSVSSALLLAMPALLLHWAVASLLVGFGIWLGLNYAKDLPGSLGKSSSLAILVLSLVYTTAVLLTYMLPALGKTLEGTDAARKERENEIVELNSRVKTEESKGLKDKQLNSSATAHATWTPPDTAAVESKGASNVQYKARDSLQSQTSTASDLQDPNSNYQHTEAMITALRDSISAHHASIDAEEKLLQCFRGR